MSAARIIGYGMVDGEPIFMDARTDTYFMLEPPQKSEVMAMLDRGERTNWDTGFAEALGFGRGPAEIVRANCTPPSRILVDEPAPAHPPGPASLFSTALLVIGTWFRLRRHPIETILEDVFARRARVYETPMVGEQLSALARQFQSARRFVPIKGNCLLDSLSLLRLLGPGKDGAMLVFGVKLRPFAAHCWVQADDLVLNDRLDNVAAFSPVRVIRCAGATQ